MLNVLKSASSVREASDSVLHDFENPADQSTAVEEKRAGMGQAFYDTYTGTSGGGETPDPDPEDPDTPEPEPDTPTVRKKKMSLLLMYMAIKR